MKKLILVIALLAGVQLAAPGQLDGLLDDATRIVGQLAGYTGDSGSASPSSTSATSSSSGGSEILSEAYRQQLSNLQVEGSGTVTRILADDNNGSRHQRFIVTLDSGQTLLIAHNIDLAPRIAGMENGDTVAFYGEYEWNNDGGVMHWTHRDPQGRHVAGWLKHEGRTYQ